MGFNSGLKGLIVGFQVTLVLCIYSHEARRHFRDHLLLISASVANENSVPWGWELGNKKEECTLAPNPSYCKIQVDRDGHHCDTVHLAHCSLKHPVEKEK
jgi:hypothetical protein